MIDVNFILPDNWVHIPTSPEYKRSRARIIDELIATRLPYDLPRDKVGPFRRMMRKDLTELTDEAERGGARAVIMPVRKQRGAVLPGSLMVTVIDDDEDQPQDPGRLLAEVVAEAGEDGLFLEVGGCPAARVSSVVTSERINRKAPSVRVNYYIAHAELPGVWALLTFTVLTDGDVDALPVQTVILMFDAIVGTMQWGERFDLPTDDEAIALINARADEEALLLRALGAEAVHVEESDN